MALLESNDINAVVHALDMFYKLKGYYNKKVEITSLYEGFTDEQLENKLVQLKTNREFFLQIIIPMWYVVWLRKILWTTSVLFIIY